MQIFKKITAKGLHHRKFASFFRKLTVNISISLCKTKYRGDVLLIFIMPQKKKSSCYWLKMALNIWNSLSTVTEILFHAGYKFSFKQAKS